MSSLTDQWHEFKDGTSGRRFQDRYERNKEARSDRSWFLRFLKPAGGVLLLIAGIFFCLVPGPGAPLILLGAAFLADVSLPVARFLDAAEVRARSILSKILRTWRSASLPSRATVAALAALLLASACYGVFLWWSANK